MSKIDRETKLDKWFMKVDEMNKELYRSPESFYPTYLPPVSSRKKSSPCFPENFIASTGGYQRHSQNYSQYRPRIPEHRNAHTRVESQRPKMTDAVIIHPHNPVHLNRNINDYRKVPRKVRNRSAYQSSNEELTDRHSRHLDLNNNIMNSTPPDPAYQQKLGHFHEPKDQHSKKQQNNVLNTRKETSLNGDDRQQKTTMKAYRDSNDAKPRLIGGFTKEYGDYAVVKVSNENASQSVNQGSPSELSRYENIQSDYEPLVNQGQMSKLKNNRMKMINQPTERQSIKLRQSSISSSSKNNTSKSPLPSLTTMSSIQQCTDLDKNSQLDRGSSSSGYYEEFPPPPSPLNNTQDFFTRMDNKLRSDFARSEPHLAVKRLGKAKESLEELTYWKNAQNQEEFKRSEFKRIREKSKQRYISVSVHRDNYLPCICRINEHTTVLELLQHVLSKDNHILTERFALVEKVPYMRIERVLEDDWTLMSNLDIDQLTNGRILLHVEERNDMYGMFFDSENWLLPFHVDWKTNRMSLFLIKEIFDNDTRSNEIRVPEFSDYLNFRNSMGKWKNLYSVMRYSGIYAGKKKSQWSSDLKRIAEFDSDICLYTGTTEWTELSAPSSYGFVLKKKSVVNWTSEFSSAFCTQDVMSLNYWYCYIRMTFMGKKLWTNYLKRQEAIKLQFESDQTSSRRSRWSNRSLNRIENVSINSSIYNATTMSYQSSAMTFNDKFYDLTKSMCHIPLGCEYGESLHIPKLRRSRSASSFNQSRSNSLTRSLSQIFNSFISPNSKSKVNGNNPTNVRALKKKINSGNGPSARRCSRSIKMIGAPFSVTSSNSLVNSYLNDHGSSRSEANTCLYGDNNGPLSTSNNNNKIGNLLSNEKLAKDRNSKRRIIVHDL